MTHYSRAEFLKSANAMADLPPDEGVEVAFAGRSNAGKSSALNRITQRRGLARTSKTPGRTQLINYFILDEARRLVDLPGYGFAKVPERVQQHWRGLMTDYFGGRDSLGGLVIVTDIRRPMGEYDRMMLDWAMAEERPVLVLLTKSDKLSRGAAANTRLQVLKALPDGVRAVVFSALKGVGVEEARGVLDGWFGLEKS